MRALVVCGLVLGCLFASGSSGAPRLNPIQRENALPGSFGWHLEDAPGHAIEGYASNVGVAAGDRLDLHVSTSPAARYRVEVYRLGWYGGTRGRLEGCLPTDCSEEAGQAQPPGTPDPASGSAPHGRRVRYVVVVRDPWGQSTPFVTAPVRV